MSDIKKQSVQFENGNEAVVVFPPVKTNAKEIVDALNLPLPKAIILCIGGADKLDEKLLPQLTQLYSRGIARAAIEAGAFILDGGTKAGVMSLMGEGVASRGHQTSLLGVAPANKISLPGTEAPETKTLLEPNHTHFVLADGNEWGDETPTLFSLVKWFTKEGPAAEAAKQESKTKQATPSFIPAVAVVASGGNVTKQEVLRTVRQAIPLIVIEGSGGFADEIAATWKDREKGIDDPLMAEIIADGELHFHTLGNPVKGIERLIIRELGTDKVLMQAWETFAVYDQNANDQQAHFNKIQKTIIWLGIAGTALVVVQQVFAPRSPKGGLLPVTFTLDKNLVWWALYYILILVPIVLTLLVTAANRFKQGNKWLLLRAGAESIKREIYSYRVRHLADRKEAEQRLAKRMEEITRRTMQTEVNLAALKPYNKANGFPPYMYAADGGDDGFSPLTPERYVQVRLGDQLSYYSRKTIVHERTLNVLYWLTFAVGALGAFLAAIGQQVWIALTTAIVGGIGTYLGYRQTENTVIKYNQTAADLASINAWWNALSASEQSERENIESLVTHTEQVLQTELDGWVQQMQNALAHLRSEQEAGSKKNTSADSKDVSITVTEQKTKQVKVENVPAEKTKPAKDEPTEMKDGQGFTLHQ